MSLNATVSCGDFACVRNLHYLRTLCGNILFPSQHANAKTTDLPPHFDLRLQKIRKPASGLDWQKRNTELLAPI